MIKTILEKLLRLNKKHHVLNMFSSYGLGVELDRSAQILFPERIKLGSHIYIGPDGYLNGRGGLIIHDHVIIAPQIVIMTSMHNYRNADMVPYDRVELLKPVEIQQCVWIGMRAIILPGVKIGEGSIIGAGSVVTKSCGPGTILAGNPAKEISTRNMDHYRECKKNNSFYLKQKHKLKFEKNETVI